MNKKIIDSFIKKNFYKINETKSNKTMLLIDRGIAESAIMNSFFIYMVNKNFKYNVDLLNYHSLDHPITKIYKSFGIKKIININIKNNLNNIILLLKTHFYFFISLIKLFVLGKSWFIKKFKHMDIYFGDIIYDEYIRNNHNFLRKNLLNLEFLKILFISIYKINFFFNLFKKKEYSYVLSPTHTYASNSAIGMRIALKNKIKVLNILNNRLRIYKKLIEAEKIEYVLDLKFLKDKKIFDKNWEKRFDLMIKKRYQGKLKYLTAKNAYYKKKEIRKKEFLKIFNFKENSFKRIVFYAPHCFSDANHKHGKFIFDDYYSHFQATLKAAEEDINSFWIIKIHPTSYKYKEENLIHEIIKNKKLVNVVICPDILNTFSLIKFADLIITGRGTVGLESSCFGKKPLLAGETFYSKFGITHNPKDKNDYLKKIFNYNLSLSLKKKEILTAKKLFYLVVFKNSYIKKDKILITNYLNVNIKSKKIHQQFLDQDNFIQELTKKLNNKINLSSDLIIQNFEKIFVEEALK